MHQFDSAKQKTSLDDLLERSNSLMRQSRELSDASMIKSEYLNLLDQQSRELISEARFLLKEVERRHNHNKFTRSVF